MSSYSNQGAEPIDTSLQDLAFLTHFSENRTHCTPFSTFVWSTKSSSILSRKSNSVAQMKGVTGRGFASNVQQIFRSIRQTDRQSAQSHFLSRNMNEIIRNGKSICHLTPSRSIRMDMSGISASLHTRHCLVARRRKTEKRAEQRIVKGQKRERSCLE